MKKSIRIFSALLALLFVLPLAVSAHGSKNKKSFTIPETFDTSKEYTLAFWAKNDSNVVQKKVYNDAIAAFEELYPNIHIEMRSFTDYNLIYNDVITNIATDTTPNVCISYPDHVATYLTGQNIVVPLDELIANEKYGLGGSEVRFDSVTKDEVISKFLNEGKIGVNIYTLPFMRSTEACYINKDYVEKLGYEVPDVLTWDFVWEVSEKALEKDENGFFKVNGQKSMIPFIYKSTDNMMISMLRQLGAGYSDGFGNVLIFNDESAGIMKTVREHAGTKAFSTFKISSYPGNHFNVGQCIFAIDSTAGATWMGSNAPLSDVSKDNIVQFETVVRPIPQYDTENPLMISQGPSICVFNKDDPNEVLASWLFAQFLLTNEFQIRYSQTEGYVPVTTRAQGSEEYKEYLSLAGTDNKNHYDVKIAAAKLLLDNVDNTFTTPVFNGSASLRQAAGQLIEEAAKCGIRNEEADDAKIAEINHYVTNLFRLDSIGASSTMKADLGEMPKASVNLLVGLVIVWVLIIAVFTVRYFKNKKKS